MQTSGTAATASNDSECKVAFDPKGRGVDASSMALRQAESLPGTLQNATSAAHVFHLSPSTDCSKSRKLW